MEMTDKIEDLKQVREALGQMELDLSYYVHLATKAKTKNKWIDVEIYKVEMLIDSIRKQIVALDRLIAEVKRMTDPLAPARGCLLGVGIMFAVWIAVILIVRMIF